MLLEFIKSRIAFVRRSFFPLTIVVDLVFFAPLMAQSVLQIGTVTTANGTGRVRVPVFFEQRSPVAGLQFEIAGGTFISVDSLQLTGAYAGLEAKTRDNKVIVFDPNAQKITSGPVKLLDLVCRVVPVLSDTSLSIEFAGSPLLASPLGQAMVDVTFRGGRLVFQNGAAVLGNPSVQYRYRLDPNYPNPFNSTTLIPFTVAEYGRVRILVYDVTGRVVRILVDERIAPGEYKTTFTPNVPSGVYFYKMHAGPFTESGKMVFIR